ncbi:MAG: serine--tRNA ligase, partial [Croceibacterium sp.]
MHDLRALRDDPAAFDVGLARRGVAPVSGMVLELDERRRALGTRLQDLQARRNEASKLIGAAIGKGDTATADTLKSEVAGLKETMPALEKEFLTFEDKIGELMAALPNIPADDVPEGADESENVEVSRWGEPRAFNFAAKEHADIGPPLGLDFETGAAMSGARFTFLRGPMARLQRALGQFMLDQQTTQCGYTECAPPLLVRDEAVFGTGQLPKFADDLFRTTDGRWLIPTAEVSLTNSVRETILPDLSQPLRLTALTPCFRSEAGAAGKDTRGFIRQHQFEKVELVTICRAEDWQAEHDHMVRSA